MMAAIGHFDIAFKPGNLQMGMIEKIVWDAFVKEFGSRYERIGENVPVWLEHPEKPGAVVASKRSLVSPPSYRIDAIAGSTKCVEIIEVKEIGNLTAIGQLLTYRMLFNRCYWGYEGLSMRLVCLRAPPTISFACERLEIEVTEIGTKVDHLVRAVRKGRSDSRV